jgi:outer membrane immunogenic protein
MARKPMGSCVIVDLSGAAGTRGQAMKVVFIIAIVAFAGVGAAGAADLPAQAPAMAPVAYNWSGCYLGIEGGANWGRSQHTGVSPNPTFNGQPIDNAFDLRGGLAGGTVGCNYQVGNWVFGIENDLSWTNKSGSAPDIPPFNVRATSQTSERWIDTLRARVGVTWDRLLVYGIGGGAFADTAVNICGPVFCVGDSKSRAGWAAGAGIEYAVWENLSLKLEYLHADFGTTEYINPAVRIGNSNFTTRDVRLTDDIVRAGLNWRFNWAGPVVARY